MNDPATYVCYVYPGWHPDTYRPEVDEWDLLESAKPYFAGHPPLARPLRGRYDDALPATARQQIRLARDHGLSVFDYFCYFADGEFVMNRPLDAAASAMRTEPDFSFATTWCVRMPHDTFPVGIVPAVTAPEPPAGPFGYSGADLGDLPIDALTVADLDRYLAEVTRP
jgi:hypothetical protein